MNLDVLGYGQEQPAPAYQILVNGADISPKVRARLMSLRLTDNRGFEADTIEIQLDDTDGTLAMPPKGAIMRVFIGWQGSELVDKGTYTIDELDHSGPPDILTIRGKSADLRGSLQKSREHSYHQQTIGAIVDTIGARHQLTTKVSEQLAEELVDHIDQANESDANFLTRLAEQFDAIATVKNGLLLFIKAGQASSASGKPIGVTEINRQSGDGHSFSIADRDSYSGVIAYWQDNKGAKKKSIRAKKKPAPPQEQNGAQVTIGGNEVMVGSSDNVKTLRHTYASKQSAERAARAMWEKLQRGVATFSITLANGNPDLFPEVPVRVRGFKTEIDNSDWILTRVEHSMTDAGYKTSVELEVKSSEIADVNSDE
ncbi:MAG: phage late control D family protein [Enterovibrio sp.]